MKKGNTGDFKTLTTVCHQLASTPGSWPPLDCIQFLEDVLASRIAVSRWASVVFFC
jgi:hypothetical protein